MNIKEYLLKKKSFLAIIVLLLIFHTYFEIKLTEYIVNPFLSFAAQSPLNDLLFFISLFVIVFGFIYKLRKGYKSNIDSVILSLIIISGYLFYRISETIWEFTPLEITSAVKYTDIIAIYLLTIVIGYSFQLGRRMKYMPNNEGFFFDNSLGENGIDLLQRNNLAKKIANKISNTSSPVSSFALGISSEWGFGKTSFLDLIKRYLLKDKIIVDFNPWLNNGPKTITKDFFKALSSAIKPYNSSLSTDLNQYAKILVDGDDSELNKIIKPLYNLFNSQKSAKEEFDEINEVIKNTNFQIIIFVDDIDRLYKEEILEVVKLIRNTANFANTFFVAAYDRNYLINALSDINNYKSNNFLEKIFQAEITLPNFEQNVLRQYLLELISPILSDADKKEFNHIMKTNRGSLESNEFYYRYLETFRDINRFANSFKLAYEFLKGEVVLSDLLNLELLRTRYLGVYKMIFGNIDKYLDTETDRSGKSKLVLKRQEIENNKKGDFLLKLSLEKNPVDAGITSSQIETIISMVNCVFPSYTSILYTREISLISVANPASVERYSHYRLLDNNLSEIEFSKARLNSFESFSIKIEEWVKAGLRWEVKTRFENIKYYNDKTDFEKIIKAIFSFARIPSNGDNDSPGFDYDNLLNKIADFRESISSKYYGNNKDEYNRFIFSLFENATPPYLFEIEFLYRLSDSLDDDSIILKKKNVELRLNYFNHFLQAYNELSMTAWHLFHYCDIIEYISNGGNSYQKQQKHNPLAIKTLKKYIENGHWDDFILQIIDKYPLEKDRYSISKIVISIFGGYKELKNLLTKVKNSDSVYKTEFVAFYKDCEKSGFGQYVKFKFETIPVSQ